MSATENSGSMLYPLRTRATNRFVPNITSIVIPLRSVRTACSHLRRVRTFILYPFVSALQELRDLRLIFLGLDITFKFLIEANRILETAVAFGEIHHGFSRSEREQSQAPLVLRF